MTQSLSGKRVAVLATDGVEQIELLDPVKALRDAGAEVHVVSPKSGSIQGFNHLTPGDTIPVDKTLAEANAGDYQALLLPGGVANPDQLRVNDQALAFIRAFFDAGKPVAAICHAPWLLIDAGVVEGRRLTSFETIRTDLRNAGADVVDEEVVVDDGLVTSRKPDDIPAFNRKMIEEIAEGRHCHGGSISTARSEHAVKHVM
ncbi:MAG: type 1 glutamine amidotransferase domain-containing protein [Pseudomonadota bacterium]